MVIRVLAILTCFFGSSISAQAVPINWVDWTGSNSDNGFTAFGVITSGSETINVTYNNPQGISFFQTGTGIDYFGRAGDHQRVPATSPFTSTGPIGVDNIPTASEMIALNRAGNQTLSFDTTVANLVFSFVSLNGNGYGFDQDFDLLSFGHASDGNDCGWWGCGTSFKNVTATEFQLLGTGEPHGSLRFSGAFDTVNWRSLSNENWNGFTVGVQGTAAQLPCEVDPTLPECNNGSVPVPTSPALIGLGLAILGYTRRKKAS